MAHGNVYIRHISTCNDYTHDSELQKFAGPAAQGVSDLVFELFSLDLFDNFSLPGAQVGESPFLTQVERLNVNSKEVLINKRRLRRIFDLA